MDIRTKLVFALVAVSLGSMLVLGTITYMTVEDDLTERTLDQLDGLAEFKQETLVTILAGWHDRVSLVATRTQLRVELGTFNRTGSTEPADRIRRILADALGGSPTLEQLWVHDLDGALVASAGPVGDVAEASLDLLSHGDAATGVVYAGVTFRDAASPTVSFRTALVQDGETIGFLHAVLGTLDLENLATNFRGLGETGETMIVAEDERGTLRVLHRVRFPSADGGGVTAGLPDDPEGPARRALRGETEPYADGLTDYRGQTVWVATRPVPDTRWGLVVKIDDDEMDQTVAGFRDSLVNVAITLSAFAILLGTFLGFRFAQPIHLLAEAADRIRAGEMDARSNIVREDEVGLLARTFDQMAGELEEQMALLHEFRKYFDVSIDLMCIASTDGYFKRINPAFGKVLGWSEEQMLAEPFFAFIHPDDVEATEHEIVKLAGGIPTISFENRFRRVDGSYLRLHWTTYPEEETGRLYAIARVVPDQSSGTP